MNYERGSVRLMVSESNHRAILIYSNIGTIFIDNEYTAKKLAEDILEQLSISSIIERIDDEHHIVVIGNNIPEKEQVIIDNLEEFDE